MIQSIEIKNFKSIKSKYFPLRNLNVLLGLNGQGKSSFIQFLLLLRQSERLNYGTLKLNGHLVSLGSTKDARYQYSKDENLSFTLSFAGSAPYNCEFDYKIEADIFQEKTNLNNLTSDFFNKYDDEPLLSTTRFQYLNAQRVEPKAENKASYSSVVLSNDIGKYGEFTAHYIELRGNEEVVFENILHSGSMTFDEVTKKEFVNKTLINQINLWLGEISPGVNVRTTKVTSELILLEYVFKQPNFGNTNRFKPENVGFGISYALHVVTALLKAKSGDLLIIENPESHIHPRGQAELGKLIALVAQNDVQIIIETHSDHILNGIRVGVKNNAIMKDRTVLFYFKKVVTENEQYSSVTNISIDKNGELSEYPVNLLDEWSNQLFKLM